MRASIRAFFSSGVSLSFTSCFSPFASSPFASLPFASNLSPFASSPFASNLSPFASSTVAPWASCSPLGRPVALASSKLFFFFGLPRFFLAFASSPPFTASPFLTSGVPEKSADFWGAPSPPLTVSPLLTASPLLTTGSSKIFACFTTGFGCGCLACSSFICPRVSCSLPTVASTRLLFMLSVFTLVGAV